MITRILLLAAFTALPAYATKHQIIHSRYIIEVGRLEVAYINHPESDREIIEKTLTVIARWESVADRQELPSVYAAKAFALLRAYRVALLSHNKAQATKFLAELHRLFSMDKTLLTNMGYVDSQSPLDGAYAMKYITRFDNELRKNESHETTKAQR